MSLKAKQGSLIGKGSYHFGQYFSEKLHENEKKFDWGKRIPSAPLLRIRQWISFLRIIEKNHFSCRSTKTTTTTTTTTTQTTTTTTQTTTRAPPAIVTPQQTAKVNNTVVTGSTQNQAHKPANNNTVSTEGTINTQGVPPHEGTQETEDTGDPLTQQTPKGKEPSPADQPKWSWEDHSKGSLKDKLNFANI